MKLGYKFLALDLDGTLLDEERKIRETTAKKLAAVLAKGVDIVLCSGRRFSSVAGYARELGLLGPVVVNNGTVVKDVASARTIYADYFPRDQLEPLLHLLRRMELPAVVLADEYPDYDFYVDAAGDGNEYHMEFLNKNRELGRVVEDLAAVRCENVSEVVVFHTYGRLLAAQEEVRAATDGKVATVVVRNVRYKGCTLEIAAPGSCKWKAIEWLAKERGIGKEEIVAIGDDANDIEMVREAGFGVAVGNALDEVKAAADYVTERASNRGVEEVIELLWPANSPLSEMGHSARGGEQPQRTSV